MWCQKLIRAGVGSSGDSSAPSLKSACAAGNIPVVGCMRKLPDVRVETWSCCNTSSMSQECCILMSWMYSTQRNCDNLLSAREGGCSCLAACDPDFRAGDADPHPQ